MKTQEDPGVKTIFEITDFGAVGDGATDCTAAIQAALDAAADCMGCVVVPPGSYLTGELTMHGDGVSLVGTSAWGFRSDGASVLRLNDRHAACLLDISGAFGCTVRGICMDGRQLGRNIHGIRLYWDKYNGGEKEDTPTVDDCRIGNFSGDGLHFEHVWCFSVRHSMLHRNGGAGLYIDGWDAFILDNWFTANKNGGIMGGPCVASITCTGNRVEWNRRGGFILSAGDSYNITGNFFDRSFGPALELGAKNGRAELVTVTGNIFRRSGAWSDKPHDDPDHSSHVIMTNCSGCVVSGNTMRVGRNDNGGGVPSPDYSFIITDSKNCVIKDNTFHNGALKENLVLRGDNSTCIIKDNIGSVSGI